MSAPNCRKAFTRMPMGRCFMRSVPVRIVAHGSSFLLRGVTARKAVIKRMAVPAAPISITSGISRRARIITSVSSQSERFCGSCAEASADNDGVIPLSAWMISARFDMLFEAGSCTSARMVSGAWIVYSMLQK